VVKRGQIWWAELPEPTASESGYRRPVLIVSSDDFNDSRINTVIVIALTSSIHLAEAPGNVKLSSKKTGLDRESVANVSQIITLDKQFLKEAIGQINYQTTQQIDEGVRLALAL
jgi:mRNA interferase MazF